MATRAGRPGRLSGRGVQFSFKGQHEQSEVGVADVRPRAGSHLWGKWSLGQRGHPARPASSLALFAFPPGDVMGPTLNHLGNLLRLPFGCGEQNMIHFAPNVFVLKYLQKTRQLSPDVERETTDYLVQGIGGTAWMEDVERKAAMTRLGAAHTPGAAGGEEEKQSG